MNTLHFGLRAVAAGLLAGSLLVPAVASAGPLVPSGTIVGTVTCGAAEETHASNIVVTVDGLNMSTHTDAAGTFRLTGVPVAQGLTIMAQGSPDAFTTASRGNVVVQAGQTLDIGNLDLSVCPQPGRGDADRSPSQIDVDSQGSDRD